MHIEPGDSVYSVYIGCAYMMKTGKCTVQMKNEVIPKVNNLYPRYSDKLPSDRATCLLHKHCSLSALSSQVHS